MVLISTTGHLSTQDGLKMEWLTCVAQVGSWFLMPCNSRAKSQVERGFRLSCHLQMASPQPWGGFWTPCGSRSGVPGPSVLCQLTSGTRRLSSLLPFFLWYLVKCSW